MSKDRAWLWPWEKDPNWVMDPNDPGYQKKDAVKENGDPQKSYGSGEEKKPEKTTPQYAIESAEIAIPEEGIKPSQPFTVQGKVKPLEGARITNTSISVLLFQTYKNVEEADGQPVSGKIDPETNTFTVTIKGYITPNNFEDDKQKPPDATFDQLAEIRGPSAKNTRFRSPAVKLPMATKSYILKKGCYDKTWADPKKGTAEYPEKGELYFPCDAIKKVQKSLIALRFLNTGNDTGFFGSLTEEAIKLFQEISQGQKRSKPDADKIFFIPANEMTFKGKADGVYGPETENETGQWNQSGWVKPRFLGRKGDVDDTGVQNGHGERGKENYHEKDQITEVQKLLDKIGAYKGKFDGWFGPKMEAAIEWFDECVEKCDFIDASGAVVYLDIKTAIKGHLPKLADESLKKAVEKAKSNNTKVPPIANSKSIVMRNGNKVPFYYQLDTEWKDDILGKNRTIGQAGCCVTCLAMVLKYYGRNLNPKKLDEYLDSHSGYEGNAVYFDVALKCEEGSNDKLSYNGNRIKSGWATVLDDRIKQNIPTIARVKYGSSSSSGGDHFVVIVGKTSDGKYIMNDPGASDGNGADSPTESNIIGDTKRKSGYTLLWIDCITIN